MEFWRVRRTTSSRWMEWRERGERTTGEGGGLAVGALTVVASLGLVGSARGDGLWGGGGWVLVGSERRDCILVM